MSDRLADEVRATLLAFARDALRASAGGRPPPPAPTGGALNEPAAVFVTLTQAGALRGCVGRTRAEQPLGEVVGDVTRDAAMADPRFPPVRPDEVEGVHIEISRLTPFEPAAPDDIEVGRHGVLIRRGGHAGLLLPKVAETHPCDAPGFLDLACRKAGLPAGAWQEPDVQLFIFEAEVFGE